MVRKEYERVTPESVGIPSSAVLKLIEAFEGITEMHGLMIMRHGKICTECWWAPYAPGKRHGLQSVTKTYAATAIGIAYTEGLLTLDDKIVDIFPESLPENPSENLKKLRIRDVLCMGCGMDTMPEYNDEWIKGFLKTPVNHVPGTKFLYNTTGSTMLGAIIKKITGLGLHDYLKPRLFDKIGIDTDNLRWFYTPDGLEMGGGGLFATTEDSLRLMHLYLNKGVWEGERILSEEFVALLGSKQIDTSNHTDSGPDAIDHLLGYGFQTWMCQPKGVYRADGAWGQYIIVFPDLDMVVSFNETAEKSDTGCQKPLDAVWDNLLPFVQKEAFPESEVYYKKLLKKTGSLSINNPPFMPYSATAGEISGKKYTVKDGEFTLHGDPIAAMLLGNAEPYGIMNFEFDFRDRTCFFTFEEQGKKQSLEIALDGSRRFNRCFSDATPVSEVYLSGAWISEGTFEVTARWSETSYEKKVSFLFNGNEANIESWVNTSFEPFKQLPHAVAGCE